MLSRCHRGRMVVRLTMYTYLRNQCPLRFLSFTPIRSDVYLITDSSDGFCDFRKVIIFYLVLK
jgi:hypothetical protein